MLASWASSQGVIAEANELLNTLEGAGARLLVKNKRGGPSVNPPVGVIRKAQRDAAHHANLLGLTPAGRADLEVEPIVVDPAEACFDKWVTRHNRKNADAHLGPSAPEDDRRPG